MTKRMDAPGFGPLTYHGGLRMIEFAVNTLCGGESDDVGDGNQ
jgi:hypothetical protein